MSHEEHHAFFSRQNLSGLRCRATRCCASVSRNEDRSCSDNRAARCACHCCRNRPRPHSVTVPAPDAKFTASVPWSCRTRSISMIYSGKLRRNASNATNDFIYDRGAGSRRSDVSRGAVNAKRELCADRACDLSPKLGNLPSLASPVTSSARDLQFPQLIPRDCRPLTETKQHENCHRI
jgi:hypothetical protein